MNRAGAAKQETQRKGTQAAGSPVMHVLARLGYAAKGSVYLIIGGLAARVAIGDRGSTTDRNGALRAIHGQPFGRFLLALVAIGLIGYALWSLAEALFDLEHAGSEARGTATRLGYAAIGVSYGALAFGAAQLALGTGNGGASSQSTEQDWTARLLSLPFGPALVVLAGLVVLALAGVQFYQAYQAGFLKHLEIPASGILTRDAASALGRAGYVALGVVFGIVGIFLIVAAERHNPGDTKGFGSALRELAAQPYGHLLLGIVAAGLLCYGLFCCVDARYHRIPKA